MLSWILKRGEKTRSSSQDLVESLRRDDSHADDADDNTSGVQLLGEHVYCPLGPPQQASMEGCDSAHHKYMETPLVHGPVNQSKLSVAPCVPHRGPEKLQQPRVGITGCPEGHFLDLQQQAHPYQVGSGQPKAHWVPP